MQECFFLRVLIFHVPIRFVSLAMPSCSLQCVFLRLFFGSMACGSPTQNQENAERGSPGKCAAHHRTDRARNDNNAHMGPIPLRGDGGTLTAQDRDEIYARTGVSCSVRFRPQWRERCLSLSGPSEWLTEARRMANERIAANGTEGGRRVSPDELATNLAALQHSTERSNQWFSNQIGELHHGLQQLSASNVQQLKDLQLQLDQLAAAVRGGLIAANEARQIAERKSKSKKKRKSKSPRASRDVTKPSQQRERSHEPEKKLKSTSHKPKMEKEEAAASSSDDATETPSETEEKTEEKSELAQPVKPNEEACSPTSRADVTGLHFLACFLFCNYVKLVSHLYTSCVFQCLCL